MCEKKELNNKELEKVNGGDGTVDSGFSGFTGFVDMYSVEGYASEALDKQELYFVGEHLFSSTYWFKGKVFRSYEHFFQHKRIHDVLVTEVSSNISSAGGTLERIVLGQTCEIYGDAWCAYTTKTN